MRYLALVSLMAAALPLTVAASQTSAPPTSDIDGRRLRLGTDTLGIYLIRGSDTVRTGTVIDQLWVDGDRLTRVYRSGDEVLGDRLDTIVSRLADLRPISYRSRSPTLVAHLSFDTAAIVGWLRLVSGDSVPVRVPVAGTVYDAASFDLVVRASDLRDSLRVTIPSFLVGTSTVGSLEGRVEGSTVVDGRPCWVFKAFFATLPVSFWIDKETRALRRQLMQLRVGTSVLFAAPRTPAPPKATPS